MQLLVATADATVPLPDVHEARAEFLAALAEDPTAGPAREVDPEREDLLIALGLRHA